MSRPKRVSLADRNRHAITGDDAPVTSDEASTTPEASAPAAAAPEQSASATKPADSSSGSELSVSEAASGRRRAASRRSSVYLSNDDYRDARSAYIVDFDHREGSPGSFGRWAARAVIEFAGLSVEERQAARDDLGQPPAGPKIASKLALDDRVIADVDDAMRADRANGVVDRSQAWFYSFALRWQADRARRRAGLSELPDPPERLPILHHR